MLAWRRRSCRKSAWTAGATLLSGVDSEGAERCGCTSEYFPSVLLIRPVRAASWRDAMVRQRRRLEVLRCKDGGDRCKTVVLPLAARRGGRSSVSPTSTVCLREGGCIIRSVDRVRLMVDTADSAACLRRNPSSSTIVGGMALWRLHRPHRRSCSVPRHGRRL